MAYASASDVSILTRNLLGPAIEFDETSTSPTLSGVLSFLSAGSSLIDTRLAGAGYGPIPESSTAYGLAKQINALFAAYVSERTRTSARVSADERTRADMFRKEYRELLDDLLDPENNLTLVGVPAVGGRARPYAGGISVSDKASQEGDADRIESRFTRGMFENPEALQPAGNYSGS